MDTANNIINGRQLVVTNLSDYPIEPIVWLWKNKIPKGSLALFSGPAGVGKTLVLLDVIARFTTGKDWPDGAINAVEKGKVLLLNAEDHVKQSLHPRLIAAGFSHGSVHILDGTVLAKDAKKKKRSIALDNDLELIESFLRENLQVGLLVIDPISNYIGEKNMNNSQAVRSVLTPVRDLAERLGITILCNSHFNKTKRGDTTALGKIGGASALHEIPRAVWEFSRDEDDKKLFHFVCAKGNETGSKKGLAYRIGGKTVTHNSVTCEDIGFIVWGDEEELDADEIFSTPSGGDDGDIESPTKTEQCKAWLLSYVTSDMPSDDVQAVAKSRGYSWRTTNQAKKLCGDSIKAEKRGDVWYWRRVKSPVVDAEFVTEDQSSLALTAPKKSNPYN
jgi:archaellum biogenesis ATPase FlaH